MCDTTHTVRAGVYLVRHVCLESHYGISVTPRGSDPGARTGFAAREIPNGFRDRPRCSLRNAAFFPWTFFFGRAAGGTD